MAGWAVEQILHFEPGDFVRSGLAHFGFHARNGRYYAIDHPGHCIALVGEDGRLEWTIAARPVVDGCPNIAVDLDFPMYVDVLPDDMLVVANFEDARLYRIDTAARRVDLLVDGHDLGMVDMGNCVVDAGGDVWINEVRGCRIWRFDFDGRPVDTLGDGSPGFQREPASFADVRFNWIYDIRRGPDDDIYVLDSKNFAVRAIDIAARTVRTIAGTGAPGYSGDGDGARTATFGSNPAATFDGPISLSLDEDGNVFVGDKFNHVVRMIDRASGVITTIAGNPDASAKSANDPHETDPQRLNLPLISSMDYSRGHLYVPTDLKGHAGDLVVLRKDLDARFDR